MNRADKRRQQKLAAKAVNKPPNQSSANASQQPLNLAMQHHNAGRLSEAESIYQQILRTDPNQPDALHLLGVIAHQVGKNDAAVELITKALTIKPDYVDALSNLGNALKSLGKFDEAIACYNKALVINPNFAMAHNNIGNTLKAQGKLDEAVESYKRALAIKPDYAEGYYNIGNALKDLGKLDEAIASYSRAISIRPNYAEAYANRGSALQELKQLNDAVASFDKAISIKPNYAEAYYSRGNVLHELKQLGEAAVSFDKAISLKPDYVEALSNLGIIYFDIGKLNEAIACFDKAISLEPNYADAHYNRGNVLQELEQLGEAITCFDKAISLNPDYVDAHINLGNALKNLGKIDNAIASYTKALTIKPDSADAYSNLCELYEKQNMVTEMAEVLTRAQAVLPSDNPHLLFRMAQLASREKRLEDARDLLELIDSENLPPVVRQGHSRLLAKTYDKLGQFPNAFTQFQITNELIGRSPKAKYFSGPRYFEQISQLTNSWSSVPKTKRAVTQESTNQHSLVFLVGFPRSGTTLLDTILRSHPDVCVVEEQPMVQAMRTHIGDLATTDPLTSLDEGQIADLSRVYFEELYSHVSFDTPQKLIIDKLPLNIAYVGLIHRVFPNAKFILALRHPCDCVLSCFMQGFELNDAMANFLTLQQSATLYNALMSLWEHYTSILDLDVGVLKYEDLIQDLQSTMVPLLNFLGIPWHDNLLNYQQTALLREQIKTPSYNQVTQDLYTQAIDRWRNYQDQMEGTLPLLEPWVKKFGY